MSKHSEEDYEAESDMRTLIEAAKIRKDSKRLSRAKKKAIEQRDALNKVTSEKKET